MPNCNDLAQGDFTRIETAQTEASRVEAALPESALAESAPIESVPVQPALPKLSEPDSSDPVTECDAPTADVPISRTIGADRLVDEMIFRFTHTLEMDWMLPGIAPTGKRVECALVVIVQFRDGKLAHEHIYWDQASVLVQLGLLDSSKLPVAGSDTARKLSDPNLPSNDLIRRAQASRELRPLN